MNYENGVKLLPFLEKLKRTKLLVNTEWEITNIALMPSHYPALLAYGIALNNGSHGNWLTNQIDHEAVYKNGGIYYRLDGSYNDDNLTIYAMFCRTHSIFHKEYKCEKLIDLINSNEVKKGDIQDFVLSALA